MTQKEHYCSDCPAWSGTDCTNNPYLDGCLKDPNNDKWLNSPENPEHRKWQSPRPNHWFCADGERWQEK